MALRTFFSTSLAAIAAATVFAVAPSAHAQNVVVISGSAPAAPAAAPPAARAVAPSIPNPAWPACGDDTVVLHDGGMVRGIIAELIPRSQVTLKLATGKVVTVPWSEVHHIEQGGPIGRTCDAGGSGPNTSSGPLDDAGSLTLVVSEPGLVLEEQDGTEWREVCTSPCSPVVPRNGFYRISGSGIQTSSSFRALGSPGSRVQLRVKAGHSAVLGLGILSVTVGGLAACIGYVALPLQTSSYRGDVHWPLPTMLIGGAGAILGAVLIESNIKTKIGQEAGAPEAGPQGEGHPAVRVPFKEARAFSPTEGQRPAFTVPLLSGHF